MPGNMAHGTVIIFSLYLYLYFNFVKLGWNSPKLKENGYIHLDGHLNWTSIIFSNCE